MISIHAPRAGGDGNPHQKRIAVDISIHAPRAGGDVVAMAGDTIKMPISIHAPRAGGDQTLPPVI